MGRFSGVAQGKRLAAGLCLPSARFLGLPVVAGVLQQAGVAFVCVLAGDFRVVHDFISVNI